MIIKKCLVIGLSLIILLVGVLAACATPAPRPTPTLTPTIPTTKPLSPALAEIIAGAKKEGTVRLTLRTGFTPTSMERLQKEIKDRFGVDLKVQFSPSSVMARDLATAIMEYKAAATPTFDLMTFQSSHVAQGNMVGIFEKVDWKPLVTEGMNPEVIATHPLLPGAIISYTGHGGLMYNPEKVSAGDVPKVLNDLAATKWAGRVALPMYPELWTLWLFVLGKEKTLADIRAILKNKAILGSFSNELSRYLLGEVWMAFILSPYMKQALDKGMPAAWQGLDLDEISNFYVITRKGAVYPNAAKLVAIYLASPSGAKFTLEESGAGNLYYPGNFDHDLSLQAKRQAIPAYSPETYPGLLQFLVSGDEYTAFANEIDLTLKGG